MSAKKQNYIHLADNIIKKLNLRKMDGYYYDTAEEAFQAAKGFLTPGCSISWGGSETLEDIGLISYFNTSDYVLYDRYKAKTPQESDEIYSKIVSSDYYFMSTNAITMDGELINVDGFGNRVACLIAGPKNVIIIAGMNKVVTDESDGISRVRNLAAPPNAVRLNRNTPCAQNGRCANCLTEDCICCQTVITRMSRIPSRIKVILVGEELGF